MPIDVDIQRSPDFLNLQLKNFQVHAARLRNAVALSPNICFLQNPA